MGFAREPETRLKNVDDTFLDQTSDTPFDSIESAQEYIGLLCAALAEAAATVHKEIAEPSEFTGRRHLDALRLVDYKLKTLGEHLATTRRILTDLRTLRRYLLDERANERSAPARTAAEPAVTSL
jgi:hypothetical protein